MELMLKDKVIVVTGGAKGIGAAIVCSCGREGAVPVIFDRDQKAIEKIQVALQHENIRNEAVVVELTDFATSSQLVKDVGRKLGHIDALVNNAGVNDGVGLEHGSPERFAASLKCNLVPYYTMAQAALPFLKESKGSIINISSKVAVTGQGGTSGYAAAKGAILELTGEWAAELLSYGIRVNTIVPSEVMTPQYEDWLKRVDNPQQELRKIAAKIPLGHRFTEAEEIAAVVTFLLSSKSKTNGQHLFVDGGYVHLDRALTSVSDVMDC